ncbi:alpha/beta-hydrolase [Pholiota conissans]|uniref:Carboxylic ester hydrolase n=1 Tax=Pholiota conissans TaxID=109636 RepID=A0A9P6CWA1_9AGAR|nr:alpha/beta-hydrolase [Pholiota conissans]
MPCFLKCSRLVLFLVYSSLGNAVANATAAPQLTVDLGYATYQGISVVDCITNKTNTEFLGIRYATPPTTALRFAAPQAPATTPGVQIAGAQPNRCWATGYGAQPSSSFVTSSTTGAGANRRSEDVVLEENSRSMLDDTSVIPPFNEDCLFLNVFIPGALVQNRSLPVVVWIHGGGYVQGSASGFTGLDIQDGNDLIREANDGVIVVVIQYRLGVFGFLSGQKVKDGGALNAGLLDQQFALQWVKKYINRFGGDPSKVIIWGESAGAGSVIQHIVANGGNTHPPLFQAAITSSTFLPAQYKFNDRIPEIVYSETVAQTNCSSSTDTLACLRNADVNVLQATSANISNSAFFGTFLYLPVVDGKFMTKRPTQLLKEGNLNGKMVYSVTNTLEGGMFVDPSTADTVRMEDYVSQVFPNFGPEEILEAQAQYAGLGSNISQAIAIMGESIIICPTYYLLHAFQGRAFKGEFAVPPGDHGNDLAYYFPSMNPTGVPPFNDAQFRASFAESFLKFAMSLDPNAKKFDPNDITPRWPMWQGKYEMLFNRTEGGLPDVRLVNTSSALLKRCEFWASVANLTAQ